jgi:DNA mismatch repair protein MSH6
LLKAILPSACLWTVLRDVEGFGYDQTIQQLNQLYPVEDADAMDEDDSLNANVPQSIREMAGCKSAIEALGSMIWCALLLHYESYPVIFLVVRG